MSLYENIKENLTAQIYELEALQSVYPEELVIADQGILADINNFIEFPQELPQRLEYSIKISENEAIIELQVCLPNDYPQEKPEVYARTSSLDRTQQLLLNEALTSFLNTNEKGDPCIYSLISWLQDNIEKYLQNSKVNKESNHENEKKEHEQPGELSFARYWIYSHHIYSKLKRRDIINLAKEHSLTGFCLPGKPGIICIEGIKTDCELWWQKIKVMNWHKILIKLIEDEILNDENNINTMRKYHNFQEISFPSSDRHNDMGQLLTYLTDHQSQHVFNEIFGIKGKFTH
ncbi:PREDICTED: RWD domain-containing protein 2A [Polistes dominula]|uniref:RWD domain-containing protein 2A n=1 Tax=Polistes dominula TaxID=743375 RepID=A0ABM1J860_POLDO|nr:PREDICTED: RWD domain-containing protein 2A [Polistes dominula]XP_015188649.1 PREDICTED: RWD domain-containing protein 2A [Polistes dominula]